MAEHEVGSGDPGKNQDTCLRAAVPDLTFGELHPTKSKTTYTVHDPNMKPGGTDWRPVVKNKENQSGLLKRYILQPIEKWLFQHQNKGTPLFTRQCSGVFHARIPAYPCQSKRCPEHQKWEAQRFKNRTMGDSVAQSGPRNNERLSFWNLLYKNGCQRGKPPGFGNDKEWGTPRTKRKATDCRDNPTCPTENFDPS